MYHFGGGMLTVGEAVHMRGQVGTQEITASSPQFCNEPKIALKIVSIEVFRDFLGGAVDKTLSSQCRGPGFDPWSGN